MTAHGSVLGDPRVATRDDVVTVTELIVGAFYDDPTWSWAFPDPAKRRGQQRRLWRICAGGALRFRSSWLTDGNTATSLWIPPGETELTPEQEVEVAQLIEEELDAKAGGNLLRAFEQFETSHPTDAPHFYLSLLATDPAQRGHGYGLGLLAANLATIDEQGMPAYLEASNPANVPLYERYGFRVIGSFDLPDAGPRVHTMWRDPIDR